jgi:hypothetical protein
MQKKTELQPTVDLDSHIYSWLVGHLLDYLICYFVGRKCISTLAIWSVRSPAVYLIIQLDGL